MKAHRIVVGLILSFLFSVLLGSRAYAQDGAQSETHPPRGIPRAATRATVRAIVDGDTLRVTLADGTKTTVQLLGVDAPDPDGADEAARCYAGDATKRLEKLLAVGREIWLETDQTEEADKRLPRYVWVEKNNGDVYFLNEVLLRDGSAVFAPSEDDTKRAERLEKAQLMARAAGRGLWFECQELINPPTPEPQQIQPADTDHVVEPATAASAPAGDAMDMAYVLSVLESESSFNALYDLIHPDARAVVPRNAVVGWYFDHFAPRGPSPAVITGVQFVSWQWAVTGQVYPRTAEVSYVQEFWDDGAQTVEEDVVRLVQDDDGTWRWFFGRSPEFVREMIDAYVAPYPEGTLLSAAVEDVGAFWSGVFAQADLVYQAPDVVVYRTTIDSICGGWFSGGPAFYCGTNNTIYVDEDWYFGTVADIGDFAWVTILAHEWGHHVQDQLAESGMSGSFGGYGTTAVELEADCLGGVYAQDAEVRGWLKAGDLSEAVTISILAGGGDHGSGDDRLSAFMAGYLDGLYGCGLTL